METETKQSLKEYFSCSTKKIQDFILSPSFETILENAGRDFDLRPSKLIDLKNETLFVLIGLEDRKDFEQNLTLNLELPKELTIKIANYIDTNVFAQFTEELVETERLHVEADKASSEAKPQLEARPPSEVPSNLPVASNSQKIPEFYTRTERQKPTYTPPTYVEPVRGLSQEDIFANRPKAKPYVTPTRDFSYRDEKIGGVNVEKEASEEIAENIDRAELLNDIENPVKSEPTGGSVVRDSYKGSDPYREPTE